MKRGVIPSIMLLFPLLMLAQEKCTDVIYPTGMRKAINNCCIYDVKDGNVVYFSKAGDSSLVEATRIKMDGIEQRLIKSKNRDKHRRPAYKYY